MELKKIMEEGIKNGNFSKDTDIQLSIATIFGTKNYIMNMPHISSLMLGHDIRDEQFLEDELKPRVKTYMKRLLKAYLMTDNDNAKYYIINLYINKVIKILISLIFPLVVTALSFFSAGAQDRVITLDEAIKLGLQNSKTLKLSQSKIDRAISEYNQARDRSKPNGSASFGYNRAEIPANKLNLGPTSFELPKNDNAYLGILSISETIFGGNKLKYAQQSTRLLTQVARLDADNDKDSVTYDIINSYYTLYKVLKSEKVVVQNIATVDQQIKQSQRFFGAGSGYKK